MLRWLWRFAVTLSLLVCVSILILWYKSHSDLHQLELTHLARDSVRSAVSLKTHTYKLSVTRGDVLLCYRSNTDTVDTSYFNRFLESSGTYMPGWRVSFQVHISKDIEELFDADQWHLTFPLSYLALATALLPTAWLLVFVKQSSATRRWLFFTASAVSFGCCALTIFLWIRGYQACDEITGMVNDIVECRVRAYMSRGYFSGTLYDSVESRDYVHKFRFEHQAWNAETLYERTRPISAEEIYWNRWGTFAVRGFEYGEGFVVYLQSPLWPLPFIFSLPPAAYMITRLRHRHLKGHCATCNYDLTANTSGICPECGTPIAAINRDSVGGGRRGFRGRGRSRGRLDRGLF
jgi:hypothetical protein